MSASVEKQHIEITPGTCGGKPRIAGHRVRVQDVVVWIEQGQSADEIVAHIPTITLSDVYAALAYYYDHRDAIDGDIRTEIEIVNEMQRDAESGILDRLRGNGAEPDSVSS